MRGEGGREGGREGEREGGREELVKESRKYLLSYSLGQIFTCLGLASSCWSLRSSAQVQLDGTHQCPAKAPQLRSESYLKFTFIDKVLGEPLNNTVVHIVMSPS